MIPDARIAWPHVSRFIADTIGLHFPRERWKDLQRGLSDVADELGFSEVAALADWLLSSAPSNHQLQLLARHLTIGETYFCRDKAVQDVLANRVLPDLIRLRQGGTQQLRLWSAGCCTGEEPYTLAILLHQLLPDLANWDVTILATDINDRFLKKARAGVYRKWSFRDTSTGFTDRYFNRRQEGYELVPEIKRMVTFAHINLVEDSYPSPATNTQAMDLILCRNVLMYFTPDHAQKVIGRLRHSLADGGWFSVSPSEAWQTRFSRFSTVNYPGVILYRKGDGYGRSNEAYFSESLDERLNANGSAPEDMFSMEPNQDTLPPAVLSLEAPATLAENEPVPPHPMAPNLPPTLRPTPTPNLPPLRRHTPTPQETARLLYESGRYAEAADTLLELSEPERETIPLLAHALANSGRLTESLTCCNRWIASDRLDAAGHYLRAIVLIEQGDAKEARHSLQRAVYLQPDFVLAHFVLGNLARGSGKPDEAARHLRNALHVLAGKQPDDILPESDGLTAGRLSEMITTLLKNTS